MHCPRCRTVRMLQTTHREMEMLGESRAILKVYQLNECMVCQAEVLVVLPVMLEREVE